MNKIFIIVAFCAAVVSSVAVFKGNEPRIEKKLALTNYSGALGIVTPVTRCGGMGTPFDLRISDCEGRCQFTPGHVYNCEKDFMPSMASPSLTLRVEICFDTGMCMQIINTVLENSSVQPGFIYTAKFSFVPNDVLSGQSVEWRAYIIHTDDQHVDICMAAMVDILALP